VPALLAALEDAESFVRIWAAAGLMRVDPSNERALEVLIGGLRDQRSFVRSLAAWHLGRHALGVPGATAALPVLQELLADEDPSVRAEAELALKVLQIESMRTRGGAHRARGQV
jgi:HEAT repeat protein